MEILKGTVILLALSFHKRLEATVKCKYEFRRFKIQTLLCAEVIVSAGVLLSKYSRTIQVGKKYNFNVFYDPRLLTHDPRPTIHDNYSDSLFSRYMY